MGKAVFLQRFCRKNIIYMRQNKQYNMTESIVNKVLNKIKKCGRGSLFFLDDFVIYGSSKAVNKVLEKLTVEGTLIRVAHGIYCYPKIEKHYSLGAFPAARTILCGWAWAASQS